jgi:heme-degrading monooxygenase HmoA
MHARVVTLTLQPGQLDAATTIFRDSVIPALRQQPGFVQAYLLSDRAADQLVSVVLWASEAALLASGGSGFLQEQFAKFAAIRVAPPVAASYEVSATS